MHASKASGVWECEAGFAEGRDGEGPRKAGLRKAVSNKTADLKSISQPRGILLARVKYNVK
jgi:hypothetical protein